MDRLHIRTPKIGDILKEEFLDPLGVTAYRLAKDIHVSTSTVLDILHNKRKLTVEMALRLSRYFNTSTKFWLNLQNELDVRETQTRMARELEKISVYVHSA